MFTSKNRIEINNKKGTIKSQKSVGTSEYFLHKIPFLQKWLCPYWSKNDKTVKIKKG